MPGTVLSTSQRCAYSVDEKKAEALGVLCKVTQLISEWTGCSSRMSGSKPVLLCLSIPRCLPTMGFWETEMAAGSTLAGLYLRAQDTLISHWEPLRKTKGILWMGLSPQDAWIMLSSQLTRILGNDAQPLMPHSHTTHSLIHSMVISLNT